MPPNRDIDAGRLVNLSFTFCYTRDHRLFGMPVTQLTFENPVLCLSLRRFFLKNPEGGCGDDLSFRTLKKTPPGGPNRPTRRFWRLCLRGRHYQGPQTSGMSWARSAR